MPYRYAFIGAGRSLRSKKATIRVITSLGKHNDMMKQPVRITNVRKLYPELAIKAPKTSSSMRLKLVQEINIDSPELEFLDESPNPKASYYDPNIATFEDFSIARELGFRTVLINTQGDWPISVEKYIDHTFNIKTDFNSIVERLLAERDFQKRDTDLAFPFDVRLELSESSIKYNKLYLNTLKLADKL